MKLEIELVPSTVWYSSLANLLPKEVWKGVRKEIIEKNGYLCQICGEKEGIMNLHEVWEYHDEKHIQKLEGFILLCKMCHHVKHIGLARILANQGKLDYDNVIEHFCRVNKSTKREFEKHRAKAFNIFRKRSNYQWEQDFGKHGEFIKR